MVTFLDTSTLEVFVWQLITKYMLFEYRMSFTMPPFDLFSGVRNILLLRHTQLIFGKFSSSSVVQTFDKVLTSEKKLRELAQTCSLIFQNALNLEYCQTKQITFAFLSALAISEKMISLFDLIWKSWRIENKSKISIVPFKNKSKVILSWCKRSQQRSSITRWIYYLMIVLIVKILSVDALVILR